MDFPIPSDPYIFNIYLFSFRTKSLILFIKLSLESIIIRKSEFELRDKETDFSGNKLLVLIVKLFSVFDNLRQRGLKISLY